MWLYISNQLLVYMVLEMFYQFFEIKFLPTYRESFFEKPFINFEIIKIDVHNGYSLKGLMLKLKLQYFWPPGAKSWLNGKDPDAGNNWR